MRLTEFEKKLLNVLYSDYLHGNIVSITELRQRGIKIGNKNYSYDELWNDFHGLVNSGVLNKVKIEGCWHYEMTLSNKNLLKRILEVKDDK